MRKRSGANVRFLDRLLLVTCLHLEKKKHTGTYSGEKTFKAVHAIALSYPCSSLLCHLFSHVNSTLSRPTNPPYILLHPCSFPSLCSQYLSRLCPSSEVQLQYCPPPQLHPWPSFWEAWSLHPSLSPFMALFIYSTQFASLLRTTPYVLSFRCVGLCLPESVCPQPCARILAPRMPPPQCPEH